MLGFVASLAYYTAYYSLSRRTARSDGFVIVSQTPFFIHFYPEVGGGGILDQYLGIGLKHKFSLGLKP